MSELDGHEPDATSTDAAAGSDIDTAADVKETVDGPAVTPRTGHPQVDAVLAAIEGLAERPLGEHVEVFETAHDRLRAALADAGQQAGQQTNPAATGQENQQGVPQGGVPHPHPHPVPRPGPR